MKRIIILTVIAVMVMVSGCGEDNTKETKRRHGDNEDVIVEEILVEDIQVEEIQVEEIHIEYIDDEYSKECEYNGKVNTWENSDKIHRWD